LSFNSGIEPSSLYADYTDTGIFCLKAAEQGNHVVAFEANADRQKDFAYLAQTDFEPHRLRALVVRFYDPKDAASVAVGSQNWKSADGRWLATLAFDSDALARSKCLSVPAAAAPSASRNLGADFSAAASPAAAAASSVSSSSISAAAAAAANPEEFEGMFDAPGDTQVVPPIPSGSPPPESSPSPSSPSVAPTQPRAIEETSSESQIDVDRAMMLQQNALRQHRKDARAQKKAPPTMPFSRPPPRSVTSDTSQSAAEIEAMEHENINEMIPASQIGVQRQSFATVVPAPVQPQEPQQPQPQQLADAQSPEAGGDNTMEAEMQSQPTAK
jgi:hypothetical protein